MKAVVALTLEDCPCELPPGTIITGLYNSTGVDRFLFHLQHENLRQRVGEEPVQKMSLAKFIERVKEKKL